MEEFTGQTIFIEIASNGSLPSGKFTVEIQIDDEELITDTYDFLQANESIIYKYNRFFEYGKRELNITVKVDTENEVNESNEDDNEQDMDFNVLTNLRLRVTGILFVLIIIFLIFRKGYISAKTQQKMSRSHIDGIIEGEIE